jgi:hypothetical protein
MTSTTRIDNSLEAMFLHPRNIRDVSQHIGRDATSEMRGWAAVRQLDDYESVQMDYSEALDFANNEFVKKHKNQEYTLDMARGQKYPKFYVDKGVERYNVDDWRTHDAQYTQEVMRSNQNFRYGNVIKKWETSLYTRNYDRPYHETGLRDTRELDTFHRAYSMDKIYGENPYVSSDSLNYNFRQQ